MESFTFLKYWRTSGAPAPAVSQPIISSAADDDGPFFDLEFSLPDNEDQESNGVVLSTSDDEEEVEEDREFDFTLSSGSSNENGGSKLTMSPSDELFFKGKLVPVISGPETESKPQLSLFKSATKLGVLMLRFKRMKSEHNPQQEKHHEEELHEKSEIPTKPIEKKLCTVKFKVEEIPMLSLFKDNTKNTKAKTCNDKDSNAVTVPDSVMNKYLKKVKPLYIRVSKRYGEKLKFSTAAFSAPPQAEKVEVEEKVEAAAPAGKQGNIPSGLRVVCKHLGKSRSASSAAASSGGTTAGASKRRDDSLLQQQDGIQSAILHCKRSFNASTDNESLLSRSVSDPSHEKSTGFSGKSLGVTEENPKKEGNLI